jgi:hypothetical protein
MKHQCLRSDHAELTNVDGMSRRAAVLDRVDVDERIDVTEEPTTVERVVSDATGGNDERSSARSQMAPKNGPSFRW